jgi:hypothetical protein
MRREKLETISSHAVPSPAQQRLTNSAPSLVVTNAFTAPTSGFSVSRFPLIVAAPKLPARRVEHLLSKAVYDDPPAKVPLRQNGQNRFPDKK